MGLKTLETAAVHEGRPAKRWSRRITAGWFRGCILILICSSALARSDVIQQVSGWSLERVTAPGGALEGCGASTMSSGWRVGLAHSTDGTWEMLFSRPSRPFEPDAAYGVNLIANGRSIYQGTAEVLPNGLAFLSPELPEAAVASLSRTTRLVYATGRGSKTLQLQGVAEVIDALRDCVRRHSRNTSPTDRPPRGRLSE
jgi:hypothetical protein